MVEPSDDEKDLRAQRTIYLLRQAIKNLLKTNKLKDISIQDISKKAMIYRTTFYSYYSDKYDLLEDYLLETWKEEILTEDIMDKDSFDQLFFWKGMQQTVDYFKRYSNLYLQLIEERPSLLFESNIIFRTIKQYFILYLDLIQPDNSKSLIPKERIADFYCSGFLNVTIHWLQNGCPERSDVLTKELITLTEHNLKSLLGFDTNS
ncbi:MAG: TetR/AcrR family transcriptional regulator C-terminal domain-containing protein [Candidatus Hodarchaeales archaeon]